MWCHVCYRSTHCSTASVPVHGMRRPSSERSSSALGCLAASTTSCETAACLCHPSQPSRRGWGRWKSHKVTRASQLPSSRSTSRTSRSVNARAFSCSTKWRYVDLLFLFRGRLIMLVHGQELIIHWPRVKFLPCINRSVYQRPEVFVHGCFVVHWTPWGWWSQACDIWIYWFDDRGRPCTKIFYALVAWKYRFINSPAARW